MQTNIYIIYNICVLPIVLKKSCNKTHDIRKKKFDANLNIKEKGD